MAFISKNCYYLIVFLNPLTSSPILPHPLSSGNHQNALCILNSVSVLLVCLVCFLIYFHFLEDFIYLFLERQGGKEKERERNINVWLPLVRPQQGTWPAAQASALTGNQTGDPLVHSPHSIH